MAVLPGAVAPAPTRAGGHQALRPSPFAVGRAGYKRCSRGRQRGARAAQPDRRRRRSGCAARPRGVRPRRPAATAGRRARGAGAPREDKTHKGGIRPDLLLGASTTGRPSLRNDAAHDRTALPQPISKRRTAPRAGTTASTASPTNASSVREERAIRSPRRSSRESSRLSRRRRGASVTQPGGESPPPR